jgi:hypothetical protein
MLFNNFHRSVIAWGLCAQNPLLCICHGSLPREIRGAFNAKWRPSFDRIRQFFEILDESIRGFHDAVRAQTATGLALPNMSFSHIRTVGTSRLTFQSFTEYHDC